MGSSPLTRGKPVSLASPSLSAGLIPAHAGKTRRPRLSLQFVGAHPRSRGENHKNQPNHGPKPGLIPAHAGKTDRHQDAHPPGWAHPRSRGENSGCCGPPHVPRGSSPLTRGKRISRERETPDRGLIPAHAGKTSPHATGARPRKAHPRSRGENTGGGGLGSHDLGSSPLTRGKHGRRRRVGGRHRLIPAHAGKTRPESRRPTGSRAHPRSRGENPWWRTPTLDLRGSSPLTRGKPQACRPA